MKLSLLNYTDREIAQAIREKWMKDYGLDRSEIEGHTQITEDLITELKEYIAVLELKALNGKTPR
jgi:uncharacterized Rossmann fold enzyme